MRLLVSSTNLRAGKTSVICGLSRVRKFRFEKLGEMRGVEEILASTVSDPDSDLTVMEGGDVYKRGISAGKGDFHAEFDKTLLVSAYEDLYLDELYIARKIFSDKFVAAVINAVPESEIERVKEECDNTPIEIIGVIPYRPFLSGTKVSSIAKLLNGKTLTSPDREVTVNRILVGAMSPNCAVKWLENAEDSALITGGDRVDLQKLALDRGVKCLILTGGFEPPKVIVRRAEESGSVIILSDYDTLTSVEKIRKEIGREALDEMRMDAAARVVSESVDFKKLFDLLGI